MNSETAPSAKKRASTTEHVTTRAKRNCAVELKNDESDETVKQPEGETTRTLFATTAAVFQQSTHDDGEEEEEEEEACDSPAIPQLEESTPTTESKFMPSKLDMACDRISKNTDFGVISFDPQKAYASFKKEGGAMCIWEATEPPSLEEIEKEGEHADVSIEAYFMKRCDTRVKFVGAVRTMPDLGNDGKPVDDSGGRCDILLRVHRDDVDKFAIPRLRLGSDRPKWMMDCSSAIYPKVLTAAFPPKLWRTVETTRSPFFEDNDDDDED